MTCKIVLLHGVRKRFCFRILWLPASYVGRWSAFRRYQALALPGAWLSAARLFSTVFTHSEAQWRGVRALRTVATARSCACSQSTAGSSVSRLRRGLQSRRSFIQEPLRIGVRACHHGPCRCGMDALARCCKTCRTTSRRKSC